MSFIEYPVTDSSIYTKEFRKTYDYPLKEIRIYYNEDYPYKNIVGFTASWNDLNSSILTDYIGIQSPYFKIIYLNSGISYMFYNGKKVYGDINYANSFNPVYLRNIIYRLYNGFYEVEFPDITSYKPLIPYPAPTTGTFEKTFHKKINKISMYYDSSFNHIYGFALSEGGIIDPSFEMVGIITPAILDADLTVGISYQYTDSISYAAKKKFKQYNGYTYKFLTKGVTKITCKITSNNVYEIDFPEIYTPLIESVVNNSTVYQKEFTKFYPEPLTFITIYYDSSNYNIIKGILTIQDLIGVTTNYKKTIDLTVGISFKYYNNKKSYGLYADFANKNTNFNVRTIVYRKLNNDYELEFPDIYNRYTESIVTNSVYTSEFSKTYSSLLPNIIIYYNENYTDILGFQTMQDIIGTTSNYYKDINLSNGISVYFYNGKRVYGNYDEYNYKVSSSSLKNIIYRVLNGIYEIAFPDISIIYNPYIETPISNSIYTSEFSKTYSNNLSIITIYYDANFQNIVGFSNIEETIGNTSLFYKTINLISGISFEFYNGKLIYGNYDEFLYKFNPVNIKSISYKVLNGLYEVVFPNLYTPYTETIITSSTSNYISQFNKIYNNNLNFIIIYYDSNFTDILGFRTIEETIGVTSPYYKNINLISGISFYFYNKKIVYGNYDEFLYKFNPIIKSISYKVLNGIYEVVFPSLYTPFTEIPINDIQQYTSEFTKSYNILNYIIIYYDANYHNIVGFQTIEETIGETSLYFKNIIFNNGISVYFYNGKRVYGNYDEYNYKFKPVSIKNILYRVLNGIYEIAFPDINIIYNPYTETSISSTSNNIINKVFSKTYNTLNSITIYYDADFQNIVGFSNIEEMIGSISLFYKTINLTNGISFEFYNGKLIYGNYNEFLYKFSPITIQTISYKISNGIYELDFPNLYKSYIENPITNNNTKEFSKTYNNILNSIIIYYDEIFINIVGFRTIEETIGQTSSYSKNINLNTGISVYFYNGKRIYGNYDEYFYKYNNLSIKNVLYRVSNGIYEIAFPDVNIIYNPYIETPISNSIYNSEFNKTYSNILSIITIYYDANFQNIVGFSNIEETIGNTSLFYKTINLANGISFEFYNGKLIYGNYDEFLYKFNPTIKSISYKVLNGIYELEFPNLYKSYIETLINNSQKYPSEFSKTYNNILNSIIIYYDEIFINIVGFRTIEETIGQTSSYSKNINLANGLSVYFYNGKRVYGNYDEYNYKVNSSSLKTIIYREANGIYEIAFPDVNISYNSYIETPISNSIYPSEFSKKYSNILNIITIYYDANFQNIVGFSNIEETIGNTSLFYKTINLISGISYYFYNGKIIYGNYDEFLYKFSSISIDTIKYKISNGIYELEFPNIYKPYIEKNINTILYNKEFSKKYSNILNFIIIYYDELFMNIIGFRTIEETIGQTSSNASSIDLSKGISYYYYNGKRVYGNYDEYFYKYSNISVKNITYRTFNNVYEILFSDIEMPFTSFIESPVTNSDIYNMEFSKKHTEPLQNIRIHYNKDYTDILGFNTNQDFVGIPTEYIKNIDLANGISYLYNSLGKKIYGNYVEYTFSYNKPSIINVIYRVLNNGVNNVIEIEFPDIYNIYIRTKVLDSLVYTEEFTKTYYAKIDNITLYYDIDYKNIVGFNVFNDKIGNTSSNSKNIKLNNGISFYYFNEKKVYGNYEEYDNKYKNISVNKIVYRVLNDIIEIEFPEIYNGTFYKKFTFTVDSGLSKFYFLNDKIQYILPENPINNKDFYKIWENKLINTTNSIVDESLLDKIGYNIKIEFYKKLKKYTNIFNDLGKCYPDRFDILYNVTDTYIVEFSNPICADNSYEPYVPPPVIDTPYVPPVVDTPYTPPYVPPPVIDTPYVPPPVIDTPYIPPVVDSTVKEQNIETPITKESNNMILYLLLFILVVIIAFYIKNSFSNESSPVNIEIK